MRTGKKRKNFFQAIASSSSPGDLFGCPVNFDINQKMSCPASRDAENLPLSHLHISRSLNDGNKFPLPATRERDNTSNLLMCTFWPRVNLFFFLLSRFMFSFFVSCRRLVKSLGRTRSNHSPKSLNSNSSKVAPNRWDGGGGGHVTLKD